VKLVLTVSDEVKAIAGMMIQQEIPTIAGSSSRCDAECDVLHRRLLLNVHLDDTTDDDDDDDDGAPSDTNDDGHMSNPILMMVKCLMHRGGGLAVGQLRHYCDFVSSFGVEVVDPRRKERMTHFLLGVTRLIN
jgi:hypothetical protein